jgi:hypothetical protein
MFGKGGLGLFLITVRVRPQPRPVGGGLYVDVNSLRLRGRRINDWSLRLARCIRVYIDDLRTPVSNFAMPEFDNPAVLEKNVEVRSIP